MASGMAIGVVPKQVYCSILDRPLQFSDNVVIVIIRIVVAGNADDIIILRITVILDPNYRLVRFRSQHLAWTEHVLEFDGTTTQWISMNPSFVLL